MKTRLLMRLRRKAKKYVTIEVERDGCLIIKNTGWRRECYFCNDNIFRGLWHFLYTEATRFYNIDEATENLSIARRKYILAEVKEYITKKEVQQKLKLVKRL